MEHDFSEQQRKFGINFGIRIEAVRLYLGLKKEEMAQKLGLAGGTYSQAIRGSSMPAPHRLEPLVDLGISSDWILFGKTGTMPEDLEKSLISNIPIAETSIQASRKPRK